MRLKPRLLLPLLVVLLIVIAVAYYVWPHSGNPSALWNIVSQKCLPNQRTHGQPAPCAQVDEQQGFVVLKDINGPLQFLLMPTARITGIESPLLLEDITPNFFAEAWQARRFMAAKYGKPIDDSNISLAINSEYGRSQNQLHIHISCLLPQVKTQLSQNVSQFGYRWQALPDKLIGHTYLARKVTAAELGEKGAFRLLAEGVPQARQQMGHYGIAMVSLNGGDFLLLATQRDVLQLNQASAEEIQDHQCTLLNPLPQ